MGRKGNPFRGFIDTVSEINRSQQEWMTGGGEGTNSPESERRNHATAWIPDVDVFVRDGDLIIRANVSGVRRQEVDATLSNGTLTISGTREIDQDLDKESFFIRERSWGNFRRSMTLPEGVDESSISATLEDGLLEVTVKGGAYDAEPRSVRID